MDKQTMTIRELLDKELDRRTYMCGMKLTAEDLFERKTVIPWITNLIGKNHSDSLNALMEKTSDVRLGHAAATYLLGVAVRDRLKIPFNLLPRLVTSGSCDGFQFFWALICLCHDLGYYYENLSKRQQTELDRMDLHDDRMDLLRIQYDLMQLKDSDLDELCASIGEANCRWIKEAKAHICGYDGYRRKKLHPNEYPDVDPVIDHGVAGALLLYDLLKKEYDRMVADIESGEISARTLRADINGGETKGVLDGVTDLASAKRFLACSLWIACTVGRHNMWMAKDQEANEIYERYDLEKLYFGHPEYRVRADIEQEQMLFLLDILDTIDPVKGIYLRPWEDAERDGRLDKDKQQLEWRRKLLLDHVKIRFVGDYASEKDLDCHWGDALTYRKIEIYVEEFDKDEEAGKNQRAFFKRYIKGTWDLNKWLTTRPPEIDAENYKATYFIPAYRNKGNSWRYDITDHEVDSLLLYEGCGVPGKYGEFYSPAEAYQTFNLLMMPGIEGEQVRVLKEKQHPRSFYITHWTKTLDVMLDIFTAQCKYAWGQERENRRIEEILYRGDRKVNVELMDQEGGTFAFTSASRENFRTEFLKDKKEPQILLIELGDRVPYFDYAGFFGSEYVFSSEKEVLLPPLLKTERTELLKQKVDDLGEFDRHHIRITGFDTARAEQKENGNELDEYEQIRILENYAEQAAAALERMTSGEDSCADILKDENHPYRLWKRAFQKLTLRCMGNIYKRYFGTN